MLTMNAWFKRVFHTRHTKEINQNYQRNTYIRQERWKIIQIDLKEYGSKRYLLAVDYFTVLICLGRLLAKYTEWEWDKLDSMLTDYGRTTKLISDYPSSACRQGTGRGSPTDGQRGTFKLFKNLLEKDWLWCYKCFTQRYHFIVKRHAHIFRNSIPIHPYIPEKG